MAIWKDATSPKKDAPMTPPQPPQNQLSEESPTPPWTTLARARCAVRRVKDVNP